MSIELSLAVPPVIELCFKLGKELVHLCHALNNSESAISEYLLRIRCGWVRLEQQLSLVQRIHHLMDDEHRDVHDQTLEVLSGKLQRVANLLHGLEYSCVSPNSDAPRRSSASVKLRYMLKRDVLKEAIEDFETWQRTADTSWFLIMQIANSQIDEALTCDGPLALNTATAVPSTMAIRGTLRHSDAVSHGRPSLSLPFQQIKTMAIAAICHSEAQLAIRSNSTGRATSFILSSVRCDQASEYQTVKTDVRDLARRLQHDDPMTFGLLACKGFSVEPRGPGYAFTLIFRVPAGCSAPRSLRDRLLASPESPTVRLAVARQLAKCVAHVHNFSFVHKNVMPESVLIFDSSDDRFAVSNVFLVGFDNFRSHAGLTQRRGHDLIERNLYQHRSRQGASPQQDYTMKHDIYSLGVCLLEVGLWESFVTYGADGRRGLSPALLHQFPKGSCDRDFFDAKLLLSLAQSKVRLSMGDRYAAIVETCLTCFEHGKDGLQDVTDGEDSDGILIATRFIKMVIVSLDMLCV